MSKTFVIVCKGLKRNEEWVLGEGIGNTFSEAAFDLATKDATFRMHYNKATGKFWGQPVTGRILSGKPVAA